MNRREFITLLGGAAAAWPLAARAQQPGKLPTIGFLGTTTASAWSPWTAAFVQRLRELGWIEGRNRRDRVSLGGGTQRALRRDRGRVRPAQGRCHCHRWKRGRRGKAGDIGHPDRLRAGGDPVGTGLVASLARPGGNVTGLSNQQTDLAGQATRTIARGSPRSPPVGDHGQCWLSRRGAGDGRGSGNWPARSASKSPQSKSGERRISRPPSRRSRAVRTHFMSSPTRS